MSTFRDWLECVRAYSIPITVMSWAVIFAYGLKAGGNIWLGLLAGLGIELAHLATNLVDDYLDYKIICRDQNFHNTVQKGKCRLICQGIISHKQIGFCDNNSMFTSSTHRHNLIFPERPSRVVAYGYRRRRSTFLPKMFPHRLQRTRCRNCLWSIVV